MQLWIPPLLDFRLFRRSLRGLSDLHLNPILRSENLALKVKASALLGIIGVKHLLEPFQHRFHIASLPSFRRFDIENLARFLQRQSRVCDRAGATVFVVDPCSCVLAAC